MGNISHRRDKKRRILRMGESIQSDGKYQFKYYINGKPHFVYSWRLEPTDALPSGKKPCVSLREMEKKLGYSSSYKAADFSIVQNNIVTITNAEIDTIVAS